MWSANMELPNPRESACYLRTRGNRSKAKTLGLQHLLHPDVGAGSEPSCGARVVHYGTD